MSIFSEFKEFAVKGNVVDLAVGVIIGAAFGKIVTSLVNDVLMPPLGMLIGKVDFSNLFLSLNGEVYPSVAAAKAAEASTLNYGLFLNHVLDFVLVAHAVFVVIRQVNRFRAKPAPPAGPTMQEKLLMEIRDALRDTTANKRTTSPS